MTERLNALLGLMFALMPIFAIAANVRHLLFPPKRRTEKS